MWKWAIGKIVYVLDQVVRPALYIEYYVSSNRGKIAKHIPYCTGTSDSHRPPDMPAQQI